jgi:hypothetical protein
MTAPAETTRKRPPVSLRAAVEWIAYNDEAAELDVDVIAGQISVVMAADLFSVPAERIARRVVRIRQAEGR